MEEAAHINQLCLDLKTVRKEIISHLSSFYYFSLKLASDESWQLCTSQSQRIECTDTLWSCCIVHSMYPMMHWPLTKKYTPSSFVERRPDVNHGLIVRLNVNASECLLCILFLFYCVPYVRKIWNHDVWSSFTSSSFQTACKLIFYKLGEISQKHCLFSNTEFYKACFPVCSKMLMLRIWCFEDDFPVLL